MTEWFEGNTAFVSAVFSWNAQKAYMRCVFLQNMGYHVRVGGQAVYQNPAMFSQFDTDGSVDALSHHNPNATLTSRGCIRNCSFCLVPKIEGSLIELDNWPVRPIVCDNNLLATSQQHFDNVINKLLVADLTGIDFNQGLDGRILTEHHANRFAELPKDTLVRLAWDNIKSEKQYLTALERLLNANIDPKRIRVYVLIGYKDTPDDALYRLEKVRQSGAWPNPMRYQPLDAKKKNTYVGKNWTEKELKGMMRYFSRLHYLGHIPFDQYNHTKPNKRLHSDRATPEGKQLELFNINSGKDTPELNTPGR